MDAVDSEFNPTDSVDIVAAKMPATSGEAHEVPATGSCAPL